MERDLVTLAQAEISWPDLSSSERINLRAVELAFVGLCQDKLFQRVLTGRGVSDDSFLTGVTSLDVLNDRIQGLFAESLTERGKERLGRSIRDHIIGDSSQPENKNGDFFSVKKQLCNWLRMDFGVDINSPK